MDVIFVWNQTGWST